MANPWLIAFGVIFLVIAIILVIVYFTSIRGKNRSTGVHVAWWIGLIISIILGVLLIILGARRTQ